MIPASQTCERWVVRLGSGFLSGGAVASEAGASAGRGGTVACMASTRSVARGYGGAAAWARKNQRWWLAATTWLGQGKENAMAAVI